VSGTDNDKPCHCRQISQFEEFRRDSGSPVIFFDLFTDKFNIIQAIEDAKIFGSLFKDQSTWINWKAALKAIFALPMTKEELKIYRKHTGRCVWCGNPSESTELILCVSCEDLRICRDKY